LIPSLTHEVSKAVVAKFNASELLTKRPIVSKQISEQLVRRAAEYNIILEDVALTHINFSKVCTVYSTYIPGFGQGLVYETVLFMFVYLY
jgi:regulator of protease activity HflC (stomatin/prohibitin superfamily)